MVVSELHNICEALCACGAGQNKPVLVRPQRVCHARGGKGACVKPCILKACDSRRHHRFGKVGLPIRQWVYAYAILLRNTTMPHRPPTHLQDTALRYFHEVVQCGSVSAASQRLHVASSAVSRQISGLEAQLGTALFERHARGMQPTAAGHILAELARRISLDAEQAIDAIHALDSLRAGLVRIATSDAFANELLPQACVAFQRRHPGLRFEVSMVPTLQVSAKLLAGEADIGLRFSMSPLKNIAVVHRQSAPVLAVLPPGHVLAHQASLTLAELARYPLALPPAETAIRQMIDLACSRQGLQLDPVLTTNHAKTLLHFVVHGGGVTVSSEVGVRHMLAAGSLVARPLTDAGLDLRDIEVQTLAGRQLPAAAQAFLGLLVQELQAMPGPC